MRAVVTTPIVPLTKPRLWPAPQLIKSNNPNPNQYFPQGPIGRR